MFDLKAKILELPQFKHFSQQGVESLLARISNDPRANWHIERLSGIGGSEVGIAVSQMREEPDYFGSTSAELAEEKLLRIPPIGNREIMMYGQYIEDYIRTKFLREFGAVRDTDTLHRFEKGAEREIVADPKHQWQRYSPDDVVLLDGKRWLVDYKAPGEAHGYGQEPLRYRAQLHGGAMLLEQNGIEIEGMLLVQYPRKDLEMRVSHVAFDESLFRDLYTANDELWYGYILEGCVPDLLNSYAKIPHDAGQYKKLSDEFLKWKLIGDAAESKADAAKDDLRQFIARVSVTELVEAQKIQLKNALVSMSAKCEFDYSRIIDTIGDKPEFHEPKLNAEAMESFLRQQGVDMALFETGSSVYREDTILQSAKEAGLDITAFAQTGGVRVTLPRKGEIVALKEMALALADDAASKILAAISPQQEIESEPSGTLNRSGPIAASI